MNGLIQTLISVREKYLREAIKLPTVSTRISPNGPESYPGTLERVLKAVTPTWLVLRLSLFKQQVKQRRERAWDQC